MSVETVLVLAVVIGVCAFVVYCPILKPWFGFRRPPGHRGTWFT
jgi:hypothetical protein